MLALAPRAAPSATHRTREILMNRFATLALAVLISARPAAAARAARVPPPVSPGAMIAFTPLEAYPFDEGRTVARLGERPGAVYLFGDREPIGRLLAAARAIDAETVRLSPRGDLVAFSGWLGDRAREGVYGVFVADTSGAILASFPGVAAYRWNDAGTRLALAYSRADSGQLVGIEGLTLWSAGDGAKRSFRLWPAAIGWGERDTLYLGFPNRVDALEPRKLRVVKTAHRSVDVSPDGRFSLVRQGTGGYGLVDDVSGLESFGCLLDRLGATGSVTVLRAEWVRRPGVAHALCVSLAAQSWSPAPLPRLSMGWLTALCDARSLDPLLAARGVLVGVTCDRGGLVVLRGDDNLGLVDARPALGAAERASAARARPSARLRVETYVLSDSRSQPPRRRTARRIVPVAPDDWIPVDLPAPRRCARAVRVERVASAGRIRVSYDRSTLVVVRIGGRSVAAADTASGEVTVMAEGVVFRPLPAVERLDPRLPRWESQMPAWRRAPPPAMEIRLAAEP